MRFIDDPSWLYSLGHHYLRTFPESSGKRLTYATGMQQPGSADKESWTVTQVAKLVPWSDHIWHFGPSAVHVLSLRNEE